MGIFVRFRLIVFLAWTILVLQAPHANGMALLQSESTTASSVGFSVDRGGGTSQTTLGDGTEVSVGYGRIQPDSESGTPFGVAIFGSRQNGVLVSEAGVPASASVLAGRIYAEVNGPVNTGLAIANPNSQSADVTFYFSDETRPSFNEGSTTIPAGGQIAAFLNQEPFNGGSSVSGTFTFTSNVPVAAIALRGLTNERSEFLMTTLPVGPLTAPTDDIAYFPHFADGGGWTTQVILVNPTDDTIDGTVQFLGQGTVNTDAQPVSVTISGQTSSTFSYTIPARSSRNLRAAGLGAEVQVGSVRAIPSADNSTPSGLAIFSLRTGSVTVAEAGVSAAPTGQAFRLFAETSGEGDGLVQTGVAVVNPSSTSVPVMFDLQTLDGESTGLTGAVTVPGNGQIAQFLNQIQGLESVTTPFEGILRIRTTAPTGISVVGLRSRYNERGDFLITTTPPVDESSSVTGDLYFPHLADGGGYTTEFILFGRSMNQSTSGTLQFLSQSGTALNVVSAPEPASDVTWMYDGTQWTASSTPPACPDPLVLTTPALLAGATSVLYPGQLRGGTSYKAHGGFRFDGQGQGHDLEIVASMDATITRAARYLEGGTVQYLFDFINPCGIMYRLDHLLDLAPRFQEIADTLPQPAEGQSMTTNLAPGQTVTEGETIATSIGLPATNNVFFDWGVYDLRMMNPISMDAAWLAAHPGEQAPYGICWLDNLSPADTAIVRSLPGADGVAGTTSDYCE